MMIEAYQDGRIVLCKDQLKSFRRRLGASQEKVAFLCAEQGLCVSIASLKRAETSKNVLYRTARDLARFYGVAVEQLCGTTRPSGDSLPATESNTRSVQAMSLQRNFVFFCCAQANASPSVVQDGAGFESILSHIAPQYNAEFIRSDNERVYYSFGVSHTQGNEAKRAIEFAKHCLQIFNSLWGTSDGFRLGLCVGKVTLPETDLEIDTNNIDSNIEALMLAAPHGNVTISEELLFAAGDTCDPLNDELSGSTFWTLDTNDQADSRDYYPIIGRRVEITLFNAVLESAKEYAALQLVHLLGNAGIGKSRLTEELIRVASIDGFTCHIANMMDFQVEQNNLTVPKLLKSLLGISDSESTLTLEEINTRNDLLLLQETIHLPLLHSLLNWKISKRWKSLFAVMSPQTLFEYQCQLISRIISMKAAVSPVLIVVEDYHWSQNTERAYIESMMENLVSEPVVLLITTRPGDASESVCIDK